MQLYHKNFNGSKCCHDDTVTEMNLLTYLIRPVKGFVPFFFHGSS